MLTGDTDSRPVLGSRQFSKGISVVVKIFILWTIAPIHRSHRYDSSSPVIAKPSSTLCGAGLYSAVGEVRDNRYDRVNHRLLLQSEDRSDLVFCAPRRQ